MSNEAILLQFDRLSVWSRGDQRAPHKPLLVLYALARWARGDRSDLPFNDVKAALAADPGLAARIAALLLERHFPESIHADRMSAVGLSLVPETAADRKLDPAFRQNVLTAYEWRYAVCGFDVRLGTVSIALDAAHIRWPPAGGPPRRTTDWPCVSSITSRSTWERSRSTRTGCCSSPTRRTDRLGSRSH